jgi:hypothetical protein
LGAIEIIRQTIIVSKRGAQHVENELKEKQVRIRNLGPILYVRDRKTALDYYHRLGFQCDYGMGFVARNGAEWIVHETKNAAAIAPNYPKHGAEAIDMHCMVVNIEELYAEFNSKGAVFHSEIKVNEYDMKVFSIIDPDGYTIGFGE